MGEHIKHQKQEDIDRIRKEEEEAADRRDRRDRYYKNSDNTQYKRRPHTFIFSSDDLDNDDVILAVESTPTYKRTKQMLNDIKNTGSGSAVEEEQPKRQQPVQGVIDFSME